MRILLFLLAAALAAAEPPLAGPWVRLAPDGTWRSGILLARGSVTPAFISSAGPATPASRPLPAPAAGPAEGTVWEVAVPAGQHRWRIDGADLPVQVAVPPQGGSLRLGVCGRGTWPADQEAFARLTAAAGGAPHLMIFLGDGLAECLGRSGAWEAAVPVVAVPGEAVPPRDRAIGAERRILPLRCGAISLPVAGGASGAAGLAADLSPWQVVLQPDALWDPSLLADPARRDPRRLHGLLMLCERLEVPLVLTAGKGGGFVSEPLTTATGGSLVVAAGGVRVVMATPLGSEGLARLDPEIAEPLAAERALLLQVEAERLRLLLPGGAATAARMLEWRRGKPGQCGSGRADGDPGELVAAAAGGDEPATAALSWLPMAALQALAPELVASLQGATTPSMAPLRARIAVRSGSEELAAWNLHWREFPAAVRRSRFLHGIANERGDAVALWGDLAAASPDPLVLRALLADFANDAEGPALALLARRIELQAGESIPLDGDALLQHRLMHAVFSSMHLSPTPLRPWAVALLPRLSALARGPVERFIERHGTVRPPLP